MRTLARVLLYDVLLALVYVASDAFLAYFYFSHGHKWWGALTVGAVALPGPPTPGVWAARDGATEASTPEPQRRVLQRCTQVSHPF